MIMGQLCLVSIGAEANTVDITASLGANRYGTQTRLAQPALHESGIIGEAESTRLQVVTIGACSSCWQWRRAIGGRRGGSNMDTGRGF